MTDETSQPLFPDQAAGTTEEATVSPEKGSRRMFPCEQCGADLVFNIGVQQLKCGFCGHVQQIEPADPQLVAERDYNHILTVLKERKLSDVDQTKLQYELKCSNCGSTVLFDGKLTSSSCAYCSTPLQRDDVHRAENRIAVDGLLPFLIESEVAARNLKAWVKSLWFAPNAFLKQGIEGKFQGVYLPFFTFDSATYTVFIGQRGDYYYVTVGSGKEQRQERRTRWSYASGNFQRFFDDVLVLAATGLNKDLMHALEPWPLGHCRPFSPAFLAGLGARTYDIALPECFAEARQRIEQAIYNQVLREIGGDTQQVDSVKSQFNAITFKHLLLPAWLLSYRYKDHVYQVFVNATTGEVQGERPWSWVKITLFTLMCLAIAGTIFAVVKSFQN